VSAAEVPVALSCFDKSDSAPGEADIRAALGPSAELWYDLVRGLSSRFAPVLEEWACSGAKSGWSLRLVHKKRRMIYLIPQKEHFLAAVVLGDRGVAAANESDLPRRILKDLNDAPKYAEGRGIRLKVASRKDLRAVETLVELKMAH
jgi:hypothetical protein